MMKKYVAQNITSNQIEDLLLKTKNSAVLLVYLELIQKHLIENPESKYENRVDLSTIVEGTLLNTDSKTSKESLFKQEFFCRIFTFFLSKIRNNFLNIYEGGTQYPNFIVNCFASILASLIREEFANKSDNFSFFADLNDSFFFDEKINEKLVFFGLKVLINIIDSVSIDSKKQSFLKYFTLKKTIQKEMIFEILTLAKGIFKFFVASKLNLETVLLIGSEEYMNNSSLTISCDSDIAFDSMDDEVGETRLFESIKTESTRNYFDNLKAQVHFRII